MSGEPAWLIAAADQRLALLKEAHATGMLPKTDIILMMLTEPADGATPAEQEKWDSSCDNCNESPEDGLYTGSFEIDFKGIMVIINFGTCKNCAGAG